MACQNSGANRRREESIQQQQHQTLPMLGRPGVLNYNPNGDARTGNFLHGQPCYTGRHQLSHSRHNESEPQRHLAHTNLTRQTSSPLPSQHSTPLRDQSDKGQTLRRRQRLSFSRWNMMISSRYKTELCRQFSEDGDCPFEDKCLFAHGQEEIRPLPRHPKYKTELCRDFHQDGFCSFGPRCNFVHTQADVASISANLQQMNKHFSAPDSGTESCDDQSSSGSSASSTPNPDKVPVQETFFHFPESLYREINGGATDTDLEGK